MWRWHSTKFLHPGNRYPHRLQVNWDSESNWPRWNLDLHAGLWFRGSNEEGHWQGPRKGDRDRVGHGLWDPSPLTLELHPILLSSLSLNVPLSDWELSLQRHTEGEGVCTQVCVAGQPVLVLRILQDFTLAVSSPRHAPPAPATPLESPRIYPLYSP